MAMTDIEIEKLADAIARRLQVSLNADIQELLEDKIMDILKLCIRLSFKQLSNAIAEVEKDI
jgi:delta 1-pyrroline-5-carboxylate dehydrogenase